MLSTAKHPYSADDASVHTVHFGGDSDSSLRSE